MGKICGYALVLHTSYRTEAFVWQLGILPGLSSSAYEVFVQLMRSLYEEGMREGIFRYRFTVRTHKTRIALWKALREIAPSIDSTGNTFRSISSRERENEFSISFKRG
jgi:hypothetical protein